MNPLTQAITGALFQFAWQGVAVALTLWIILYILRRSRPETRYAAACVALFGLASLPVVTAWRLYSPMPSLAGERSMVTERIAADPVFLPDSILAAASQTSMYEWAFPAWLLGVSLLALRFVWGTGHLRVLRRSGTTADDATVRFIARLAGRMNVRRFQVLFSPLTDVPGVIGWIRPVVLLPAATLTGLTPSQLEAVIAHELAHIRRHDYAVNILQMIVETLLFYHPAVWWTSRRIRVERELCCDDLAVRTCGDRLGYARALATIEKRRSLTPGFAVGSGDGPLLFRIRRLVSSDAHQPAPSLSVGSLVLFCAGILTIAANSYGSQALQQEPESLKRPAVATETTASAVPLPAARTARQAAVLRQAAAQPSLSPQAQASRQQNGNEAWYLYVNGRAFSSQVSPEQAATLRNTFTGDFLWFRLAGSTYVTQDRQVLERMAERYNATRETTSPAESEQELAKYLNQLAERQARSDALSSELARMRRELERTEALSRRGLLPQLEVARLQAQHAAAVAEIERMQAQLQSSQAQIREAMRRRESVTAGEASANVSAAQGQIASLQNQLMAVQAQIRQLETDVELRRAQQLQLQESMRAIMSELQALVRDMDAGGILREAVDSGAAKPVP